MRIHKLYSWLILLLTALLLNGCVSWVNNLPSEQDLQQASTMTLPYDKNKANVYIVSQYKVFDTTTESAFSRVTFYLKKANNYYYIGAIKSTSSEAYQINQPIYLPLTPGKYTLIADINFTRVYDKKIMITKGFKQGGRYYFSAHSFKDAPSFTSTSKEMIQYYFNASQAWQVPSYNITEYVEYPTIVPGVPKPDALGIFTVASPDQPTVLHVKQAQNATSIRQIGEVYCPADPNDNSQQKCVFSNNYYDTNCSSSPESAPTEGCNVQTLNPKHCHFSNSPSDLSCLSSE